MNVAIIGGTGFVGSYIVQALERDGHAVSLLVRPGSEAKIPPGEHFRRVTGDVSSPDALDAALSDCDAADASSTRAAFCWVTSSIWVTA